MNKKTFTTVRLAVYFLTIIQLMFNPIKSNIFTGVMITLGVICVVIDIIDLTGRYRKIENDTPKNKKK